MSLAVAHEVWTRYIGSTRLMLYLLNTLAKFYETVIISAFRLNLQALAKQHLLSELVRAANLSYNISDNPYVPGELKIKLMLRLVKQFSKTFDLLLTDVPFDFKPETKLVFYNHFPLEVVAPERVLRAKCRESKYYYLHYANKKSIISNKARERIFYNAELIFVNSKFSYRIAQDVLPDVIEKVEILHPPIDYNSIASKIRRSKKEIDEEKLKIVLLGRISRYKFTHVAVEALERLSDEVKRNIEIIIIGDYSQREKDYVLLLKRRLEQMKIDNRWFLRVSEEEKYSLLAQGNIYIHTKPYEHFGISVIEAMATGNVPVVHRSGGPWEDITAQGKYGLGYSNTEELALQIETLYNSPALLEKYSKLAQERAKAYDVRFFEKKLINYIDQLV